MEYVLVKNLRPEINTKNKKRHKKYRPNRGYANIIYPESFLRNIEKKNEEKTKQTMSVESTQDSIKGETSQISNNTKSAVKSLHHQYKSRFTFVKEEQIDHENSSLEIPEFVLDLLDKKITQGLCFKKGNIVEENPEATDVNVNKDWKEMLQCTRRVGK